MKPNRRQRHQRMEKKRARRLHRIETDNRPRRENRRALLAVGVDNLDKLIARGVALSRRKPKPAKLT